MAAAFSGANTRFCNTSTGQLIVITSVNNTTLQTVNLWLSTCTSATEQRVETNAYDTVATLELVPVVPATSQLLLTAQPGVTTYLPPPLPEFLDLDPGKAPDASGYVPWLFATDAIGATFTLGGTGDGVDTGTGVACNTTFIPAVTPNGTIVGGKMLVTYAPVPTTLKAIQIDGINYAPDGFLSPSSPPYLFMSITIVAPPVFVFANAPGQVQCANARLFTSGTSLIHWAVPNATDVTKPPTWNTSQNTLQKFYAGALANQSAIAPNYGAVQIRFQTTDSVVTISVPFLSSVQSSSDPTVPYDSALTMTNDNVDERTLRGRSTTITVSCQALLDAAAKTPNTWICASSSAPDFGLLKVVPLSPLQAPAAVNANLLQQSDIQQSGTAAFWLYFRCAESPPTMAAFAQDVCFTPGFELCRQIGGQSVAAPATCLGYFDATADASDGADEWSVGETCRKICGRAQTGDAAARQTCQRLVRAICDAPGAEAAPECACQRMQDSTVAVDVGGTLTTWQAFTAWFASVFDPSNDVKILTQAECWWPACAEDEYGSLPSTTIAACPSQESVCFASIGNIDISNSKCAQICIQTACGLKPKTPTSQTRKAMKAMLRDSGCTDKCNTCADKCDNENTNTQSKSRARARARKTGASLASVGFRNGNGKGAGVSHVMPGALAPQLLPAAIALLVVFVVLLIIVAVMIFAPRRSRGGGGSGSGAR